MAPAGGEMRISREEGEEEWPFLVGSDLNNW